MNDSKTFNEATSEPQITQEAPRSNFESGELKEARPQEPVEEGSDMGESAPEVQHIDQVSNNDVRGISINPLNSGYMVKVGCQSVAVETTEKLIDMLNKYLSNPGDFERKWYSKDTRNRLENI